MKTLRKYATMALLSFSVATMVPTYANPVINEQEQIKQEETIAKYEKSIRGRILRYSKDHPGIVLTTYAALLTSAVLAIKYDLCKNNKQLEQVLAVYTTTLILMAIPLAALDED